MGLVHDLRHVLADFKIQFIEELDIASAVVEDFLLPGFQVLASDDEVPYVILYGLVRQDGSLVDDTEEVFAIKKGFAGLVVHDTLAGLVGLHLACCIVEQLGGLFLLAGHALGYLHFRRNGNSDIRVLAVLGHDYVTVKIPVITVAQPLPFGV